MENLQEVVENAFVLTQSKSLAPSERFELLIFAQEKDLEHIKDAVLSEMHKESLELATLDKRNLQAFVQLFIIKLINNGVCTIPQGLL